MKPAILFCLFPLLPLCAIAQESQQTRNERFQKEATRKGLSRLQTIRTDMDALGNGKTDELLIKLGNHLHFLADDRSRLKELRREADELRTELRETLVAIPGHAEAYERLFLRQRAEVVEGRRSWNQLHDTGIHISQSLRHLPSPETVSVLGRMLSDTKGSTAQDRYPGQATEVINFPKSAAEYAVIALYFIGLQDSPLPRTEQLDREMFYQPTSDQVEIWQVWWRQITEGKRTYRLRGSAVSHGPRGPVDRAAD